MHVPLEVGFWSSPRMLAFARAVHSSDAGAWVARIREFVMVDPKCRQKHDGSLPGYSSAELMAIMGATGHQRSIMRALVKHGFLVHRRGTWCISDYRSLPISNYFQVREAEARRKREMREASHIARVALLGNYASVSRPSSVRGTSVSRPIGRRGSMYLGRPSAAPPVPPSGGEGKLARERWEWFSTIYPRIRSPEKCALMLAELSAEEYIHLQFSLPKQVASSRWIKNARYVPTADKYLRTKSFMEIKFSKSAELDHRSSKSSKESKKVVPTTDPIMIARRYLMDQLSDPDLDDRRRIHLQDAWNKLHPGDTPWKEKNEKK